MEKKGTATLIRQLVVGWKGNVRLYKVDPPMKYDGLTVDLINPGNGTQSDGVTEYIIVSSVVAMFSGPETYIFPATKGGKVINRLEMEGSFRGAMSHTTALKNAGYELVEEKS